MQIKNAARNPLTNPRGHFIVVTLERILRESYALRGPLSTLQEFNGRDEEEYIRIRDRESRSQAARRLRREKNRR